MSDSKPWWFSGGEPDPTPEPDRATDQTTGPTAEGASGERAGGRTFDLLGLASGAQQLVDMAKQAIWAPHTEHVDPADHGDCIICRALVAFDDVRKRPERSTTTGPPVREVDWIDLDPPVPA
jgi:hypothetical protein